MVDELIKEIAICPHCSGEAKMFGRKDLRGFKCQVCNRYISDRRVFKKQIKTE